MRLFSKIEDVDRCCLNAAQGREIFSNFWARLCSVISRDRGVFREGGCFGGQPPLFWKKFFNLLGFFEKKNPKSPI